MHRDRALAFLRLEIIGLALAFLVAARQDRARPDVLNRVGPGSPILLWCAVFDRPGDDTQPGHMLVVDRHGPGELRAALLALWCRAGLADVGDDKSIWQDAFCMTDKAVAVRQVLDEVVAHPQRGFLKADAGCAPHQRSLELVAADHLVQYQQMPRIDDVLVMLQPVAV